MAYGLRRCLEIARALALEPQLIFLDEPAAGMTRDEFKVIMNLMMILKEKGITTLLVEHTMDFIKAVADWVYVLNFGQIIAKGTFDVIEKDPLVLKAYLGED
jgi:ABC-type branched-subunit amino acid transport system ATPase component